LRLEIHVGFCGEVNLGLEIAMLMASLVVLHLLAALVWVGGMFFAHSALRPTAASVLQPPERLTLISGVFGRFFVWVKGAILLLFLSGFGLIHMLSSFGKLGWYVHTMLLIAVVMTVIFAYIYGGPFRMLKSAVAAKDWPAGGLALAKIRPLIFTNLILGLITVAIGAGGRYI
jgi:uncharacterized membrane protein